MPRRIDIELTSSRDDDTWTWRAAGAREPKGTLPTGLVPAGSKVGDVLRVDAEFYVDGIEITGVVPAKGARKEPERLELIAPATPDEPLVTTALASRARDDRGRRDGRRDGGRDGGRRDRGPRDRERGERGDRERGERPAHAERGRGERADRGRPGGERPGRRSRPEPPPMPAVERPKAKRLRAGKAHRSALLESLPEEQRPIAEQVVLGGLPAVRQAIEKQNAERAAAGESAIGAGPLLEIAEKLVPKVRAAEWRDRAEAAQRDLEHVDLRDLRSVVSTADAAGKDEESRALAQALKEGLAVRVDAEHATWLAELTATLDVGRIVRALRVSSRPPKAGAPLPPELTTRLVAGAGEALTADAAPERWVAVLDALAFSPVRDKVIPASLPKELHDDVRTTIARLATRIPKIAHIFEITPDRSAPRPKQERRRPPKPKRPPKPEKSAEIATASGAKPVAAKDEPPVAAEQEPEGAPEEPEASEATLEPPADQAEELAPEPTAAAEPEPKGATDEPATTDAEPEATPEPTEAEPADQSAEERAGEAAGGAGVSPADGPESGSAAPEAPEREPQASSDEL